MTMRIAPMVLAGLVLTSCVSSGAAPAGPYKGAEIKQLRNYTSHSVEFFRNLLGGRVWVYENPDSTGFNNMPFAAIFAMDGRHLHCNGLKVGGIRSWTGTEPGRWSIVWVGHGATMRYDLRQGEPLFAKFFYEPESGSAEVESFRDDPNTGKRIWTRPNTGWVQDTLPRSLADACPNLRLPAGLQINEKQTSQKFDELRWQDPEAAIRNFPGSDLTAPGRTGVGASKLAPTTTRDAVFAFMRAQHGNIVLSPKGNPRVLVVGDRTWPHELWQMDKDGRIADTSEFHEVTDDAGEWLEGRREGKVLGRYPMGYPFPYLPTGYRHAAFQLTDVLIESGEPVVLPWMPSEWKDFTFRADGTVLARRANGGPDRLAPWRWTKGRLWVQTGDNREAPGWEEVAEQLGMEKPKLWTPADGQRIEMASAEPATSGTGRCAGEYEGTATWTLGADGKKVWDTSACERRTE